MKLLNEVKKIKQETYIAMLAKGVGEKLAQEVADLTYQINILNTTPKDHEKDKDLKEEFDRICKEG